MLYHLLYPLRDQFPVFSVVGYITFRTAAASLTALALSLLLGPWLIRRLRAFQIGQVVRTDGPASHKPKAGTPTMGGLLILAAVVRADAAVGRPRRIPYIWIARDRDGGLRRDRLRRRLPEGHAAQPPRAVRALQVRRADRRRARRRRCRCWCSRDHDPPLYSTRLIFPFFKSWIPDLRLAGTCSFAVLVLVGVDQRREPDRRARRAGDQHVRGVGRDVHRARLRHRPPRASPNYLHLVHFPSASAS